MNAKAHFRGPGLVSPGAKKGDGPPVLPSSPKLLSGVQGLLSGVEWFGPIERMKENDQEAEKEHFSGGDNGVTRSLVCMISFVGDFEYSWTLKLFPESFNFVCKSDLRGLFPRLSFALLFLVVLFRFSVATTRPSSAPCTQPCSIAQRRSYLRCAALHRDWTCQL